MSASVEGSATAASTSPAPSTLQPGDVVRVRNPEHFVVEFARKVKDRDASVVWVGPTPTGMFKGQARVRFLKRNGRGKEFEEVMALRDLELKASRPASAAPSST